MPSSESSVSIRVIFELFEDYCALDDAGKRHYEDSILAYFRSFDTLYDSWWVNGVDILTECSGKPVYYIEVQLNTYFIESGPSSSPTINRS